MTSMPLLGFHFNVTFGDGKVFDDVSFSEVSVIDLELLTKESCSLVNSEQILSPSGFKYTDLELKRGKAGRHSMLFKWLSIQVTNQKKIPITIIVNVLNHEHKPSLTWTFTDAYPIKYQTAGLNSKSNEVIIETITFKFTSYKFRQNDQKKPKKSALNITPTSNRKSSRINRGTSQRKLGEVEKTPLNTTTKGKKSSRFSASSSVRKLDEVEKTPLDTTPPKSRKSSRIDARSSERKLDEVEKTPLDTTPPKNRKSSRVDISSSKREIDEPKKTPLNIDPTSGKESSRINRNTSSRKFKK